MHEMTEILEKCVSKAVFANSRLGRLRANDLKKYYREEALKDPQRSFPESFELEIRDEHIAGFIEKLDLLLANYKQPGTDCVGNGLYLLMGGYGTFAQPTVTEFAKALITAAAKIGSSRVVELATGWARGEPLRYRGNALLEGVNVDKPLQLAEGVHLLKSPNSSVNLPASFLHLPRVETVNEYLNGVVLSFDCEMSPALYAQARDEKLTLSSERQSVDKIASGKIPGLSFDSFCDSMSLACNNFVTWQVRWDDYGELLAFHDIGSSFTYKPQSNATKTTFSQENLDLAREIQIARHENGEPAQNLELAIRRWNISKESHSVIDKLIDLRIALEALYDIKEQNEKGFRLATYAAWHLGDRPEKRRTYYQTLKQVYADASKVLHAGELKLTQEKVKLVSSAQNICREGILKRLNEKEEPKWEELVLGMHS